MSGGCAGGRGRGRTLGARGSLSSVQVASYELLSLGGECPLDLIVLWLRAECSIVIIFVALCNLLEVRFLRPHLSRLHIVDHLLLRLIYYGGTWSRGSDSRACGARHGLRTLRVVWFVFKHFTRADGSTLVSESEATHLLNDIELLE